jgi:invasion protein IalB
MTVKQFYIDAFVASITAFMMICAIAAFKIIPENMAQEHRNGQAEVLQSLGEYVIACQKDEQNPEAVCSAQAKVYFAMAQKYQYFLK